MGILEDLTLKLHLEYISDLRFIEDTTILKACINAIPEKRYTLTEWQDAARYVTENKVHCNTKKELIDFFNARHRPSVEDAAGIDDA